MRNNKYILDATGKPVPEPDLHTWANWFETFDRQVAKTRFCGQEISTVFLGLDHSFSDNGAPVLWETMIFSTGRNTGKMLRCPGSREQAEAMHAKCIFYLTTGRHVGAAWFCAQSRKRRRKMFRQEKRRLA